MQNKILIEEIRHFTRFYSHFFGLYNNKFLESRFSLTEARVIFELGIKPNKTSKDLSNCLQLDPGYLSRILKKFEIEGYLCRKNCTKDGRKQYIILTAKGKKIRLKLDQATNRQIEEIISGISETEKQNLCRKMNEIEAILNHKIKENK